jgi:hypothetical protein
MGLHISFFSAAGRRWGLLFLTTITLVGCADRAHQIVISVPDQRMVLLERNLPLAMYPVSTSKFGVGDRPGSNQTPLGALEIRRKIGGGAPVGAKFKSRERTGEVVAIDAPGRDPIVTRILWLRGLEARNANAYDRYIYIHGTPEERRIGQPASFGCVRMRSRDVIALYDAVGTGARVFIRDQPLAEAASPFLAKGVELPRSFLPTPAPSAAPVSSPELAAGASVPPSASIAR